MKKLIVLTFCVFCFLACSSNRQESFDIYTTNTDEEYYLVEDNRQLLDDAMYLLSIQENTSELVSFYEDNPIEIRFYDEDSFIKLVFEEDRIYIPENATESESLLYIVLARALNLYRTHKEVGVNDTFYQLQETAVLKDVDMFEFLDLDILDLEINQTGREISDFICLYHFENKSVALENYKQKLELFAKEHDYDIKDLGYIKYWNNKLTNSLENSSEGEVLGQMEQYFKGNRNPTHIYEGSFAEQDSHNAVILNEIKKDLYYKQTDTLADIETIYKEALLSEEEPMEDSSNLKHCTKILYR